MTEEEIEYQIQSYSVEDASLPFSESGMYAKDCAALEAVSYEHERKIGSTFQFRLPPAWYKTRGKGVRVALLDTGVDIDHPNLKNSITETKDFTDQGIEDLNGHGTQCAGIIGAAPIEKGITGLAPECELLIGKVIDNENRGNLAYIAEGVDWAVDCGAHIICMSVSGASSSPLLYRSLAYALAKGVHFICAVDESDPPLQKMNYPARYGGSITVTAHDLTGIREPNSRADFAAPGQKTWSTYKSGSYREFGGSSLATAFVTGIAALAVSRHLSIRHPNTPIFNCEDLRAHLSSLSTASSCHKLPHYRLRLSQAERLELAPANDLFKD